MNRRISSLEPVVADKCIRLISLADKQGIRLIVTSTLRAAAEQRALYAQGRGTIEEVNELRKTAGMYPIKANSNRIVTRARRSMHEFGCAFDIAILDGRGFPVWDAKADMNENNTPEYREVGLMGESLGLTWGGRFGFSDLCHFEFTNGLTKQELIAGMRPADTRRDIKENVQEKEDTEMVGTKKGLRTSEFYMALLGAVLPVINTHLGAHIPVSGVMSIAGVVISYILSRTVLKRG